CRHRGDEILSVRVHAVHVRPVRQHDRPDSIFLHGDEPVDNHRNARAAGVLHRRHLRLLEERIAISQALRAERRAGLYPAGHRGYRGAVVHFASGLPQRAVVRQYVGRPHHPSGFRRLHHHARRVRRRWLARSRLTAHTRHHAHGARVPGRFPASLRLRHSHLHLSQRCDTPGPLTAPSRRSPARGEGREGLERSVPMDPTAAKYIGAGIACIGMGGAGVAVGIIFGNYLAAALRNPSAAQGQFGNLIFGFAITEALGIFSLLIALLLLFGLEDITAVMAEPAAHSQVPAGHPAFPPFQAEHFPSQLVWLAVSFVLLYVLMAKVALPRIAAIFAERSKRIGDDLKAAESLKVQSDAAHAAYEKALADARGRAQAIAAETRERQ